jgi:drug/metabolite transporter (DMT)-like permease
MHVTVLLGLALALACAIGASVSGLWKQKGAVQVKDVDIRRPVETALALFRSKWFLIGWLAAAVAWGLHVGALALAPISLGQAVISGGIVLLGLIAERFFDFKLKRRQWIGLVLMGAAMAVLGATAHSESNHTSYGLLEMAAFEFGAIGLGVACVLICRLERLSKHQGVLLGAAGGVLFGICDVSIKAVTSGTHGPLETTPWALIGVLCAVAAFYATARSLQVGDGVGVIAATASMANLLGILGGIVIFGDPLGKDTLTVAGRVTAFILAVVAVALVPAPTRANKAVREQEEKKLEREQEQEPERAERTSDGREAERAGRTGDERGAEAAALGTASAAG